MGASALHLVPHRLRRFHVGASPAMTIAQLQALAASVGFPPDTVSTAAAVAMAESSGRPEAYGDATLGGSVGLWQINLPAHPQYQSDPSVLYDPVTNAKAALAVSNNGANWNPWTTYRCPCGSPPAPCEGTPCYQQYLVPYTPAASSSVLAIIGKVLVVAASAAAVFFGAPHAVRAAEDVL